MNHTDRIKINEILKEARRNGHAKVNLKDVTIQVFRNIYYEVKNFEKDLDVIVEKPREVIKIFKI